MAQTTYTWRRGHLLDLLVILVVVVLYLMHEMNALQAGLFFLLACADLF